MIQATHARTIEQMNSEMDPWTDEPIRDGEGGRKRGRVVEGGGNFNHESKGIRTGWRELHKTEAENKTTMFGRKCHGFFSYTFLVPGRSNYF